MFADQVVRLTAIVYEQLYTFPIWIAPSSQTGRITEPRGCSGSLTNLTRIGLEHMEHILREYKRDSVTIWQIKADICWEQEGGKKDMMKFDEIDQWSQENIFHV